MSRNSCGNVRKLPSVKFQARYCIDYVWHSAPATFRTKKETYSFLAGARTDLDRGVWLDPGRARCRWPFADPQCASLTSMGSANAATRSLWVLD